MSIPLTKEIIMETKDPALTKTAIHNQQLHVDSNVDSSEQKGTETLQETVIGSGYIDNDNKHMNNDEIEDHTTINKGTDTFEENIVHSKHVNEGDNPARQPDRRDQQGSSAFDEGINEDTVGSAAPKSEGITDENRYASIDNAQTRILNPDEKD
jgi:hypothetical protein